LRMRDATSVVVERDDLPILPSPMVVVDPSADYWEGKEFRYDLTDSAGNQEKISVRIFEDEVAPDDPDLLYADTVRMSRRDDTSPSSLFEKRALVCDWVYVCANAATYVAYVSANEIAAAASAFGTFLRANDYKGIYTHPLSLCFSITTFMAKVLHSCEKDSGQRHPPTQYSNRGCWRCWSWILVPRIQNANAGSGRRN